MKNQTTVSSILFFVFRLCWGAPRKKQLSELNKLALIESEKCQTSIPVSDIKCVWNEISYFFIQKFMKTLNEHRWLFHDISSSSRDINISRIATPRNNNDSYSENGHVDL